MEEIIIHEEPQFTPMYAMLTPSGYEQLNTAISIAKGYPEGGTQRYAPDEPAMSAPVLDEEGNEIEQSHCVMLITAAVQRDLPEVIEGLMLVDRYTPLAVDA